MNKFALSLVGAAIFATTSVAVAAETDDTLVARSTVVADVVTVLAPLALLVIVTAVAEGNETPSATVSTTP